MCQRSKIFFAALVLFSLLRASLSAQAYSPDGVLENQLEAKIIVIRLSASLTLRETILSQREDDWTAREKILADFETGLNAKEKDLKTRETSIEATEKTFSDLNSSLTTVSKKYALAKKALWIAGTLAALEAVILLIK